MKYCYTYSAQAISDHKLLILECLITIIRVRRTKTELINYYLKIKENRRTYNKQRGEEAMIHAGIKYGVYLEIQDHFGNKNYISAEKILNLQDERSTFNRV